MNATDQYQSDSSDILTPYREQPRSTHIFVVAYPRPTAFSATKRTNYAPTSYCCCCCCCCCCSKHSRRFAGLEACFLLVTVRFFLFLIDKLRRKHPFKHANKKKTREDCCIVQVTCKTIAFRFFQTHSEVRIPWHRARSRVSCTPTEP